MNPPIILNIDDNDDDQLLLKRAWRRGVPAPVLQLVGDGEKGIEYLEGRGEYADRVRFPLPSLILLDLKMPRKNGFEVLDWIRQHLLQKPPAAIFSSSQDAADIGRAYDLGARWYLAKPVDYAELKELVQLIDRWFADPSGNDLSSSPHYRAPQWTKTVR